MPKSERRCIECNSKESPEWWKCCSEHTTEHGPDVVCLDCKNKLHPICGVLSAHGFGLQFECGFEPHHENQHSWGVE